jgi:hypothetical protein
VKNRADRREVAHERQRVVDRLTAVNDNRPAELGGEAHLPLEELPLSRAVGEVVVVIESHFA